MDDLLDLSWSDSTPAAPKHPTLQPQTSSSSRQPTPSSHPTFDFLAKPESIPNYYSDSRSTPPARDPTPKTAPLPHQARLPDSTLRSTTPNPLSVKSGGHGDAFSSLFSLAGGSNATHNNTMSLADRQKQAERERAEKAEKERQQFEAEGSFWDNLGSSSIARATSSSQVANGASAGTPFSGFDDLLAPQPVRPSTLRQSHTPSPTPTTQPAATTTAHVPGKHIWDDDDTFLAVSSKPSPQSRVSPHAPADPFNFEAFDDASTRLAQPSNQNGAYTSSSGMRTPASNFDFGNREGGGDDDDDDFLSDLREPPRTISRAKTPPRLAQSRPSSPPPHIIGQLVEMGFSPAQARSALAQTQSGVDVQAALESLLTALAGSSQAPDDFGEEDRVMRERSRREEDEAERRRRRRAGPSRDSVRARTKEEVRSSTPRGESEYGEQADKIIAQASEMGQSFLKGATSFWNASKEKALRAYEEQRRAMEAGQEGRRKEVRTDGRPRWMVEAEDRDAAEAPMTRGSGGFKDSDDEEDQPRAAVMPNTGSQRRQQSHRLEKQRPTDDLLDNPRSYQPASRHPAASSSRASAIPRHATPIRQATPPPLPKRLLVDASPSQIQSSATKKTSGNEHFKLGRFPEAESAYTSAIASLPEGHLFLVPLYNNRAATRLKLGQSASAIEDCSTVIELIGPTYHPSKEAPLPDAMASEVKLGEGLIKAVMKRAQAYEMGEKWKQALEDWERVLGSDASLGGGSRGFASEGVRRAKKMLDGGEGGGSVSTRPPEISRPAKPTAPPKPVNVAKSQAVTQLRKANQAAEAEDNQRAELRETVDAKVLAWKGGKENNLRALIASLNTVLWPEILGGGLVVGMHELITDKQVKIKYMKVIARLHPDKLNTMTTTVEQKMLANSVFHELNTAWSKMNGGS